MYFKSNKTMDNAYGIKYLDNIDLSKPILTCFFPSITNVSSMNGYLSKIMYLLQIRGSNNIVSNYSIEDIPFSILSDKTEDNFKNIIIDYINKSDKDMIKNIFRNINIVSYCGSNDKTYDLLNNFYNALIDKGFSKEESTNLLNNIFILQVVDNIYKDGKVVDIPYGTIEKIHNIFDDENYSWYEKYQNIIDTKEKVYFFRDKENINTSLYISFGEGSLKEERREHEFKTDYVYSPIINGLMSIYLINSINCSLNNNDKSIELIEEDKEVYLKDIYKYIEDYGINLDDYKKEDILNLNKYIENYIQEYFMSKIDINKVSREDAITRNNKDNKLLDFYNKWNKTMPYENRIAWLPFQDYLLSDIDKSIKIIIDKFNNREINNVEIIHTNDGDIEIPIDDFIKEKIQKLFNDINKFLNIINNISIEEDLRQEFNMYLNETLNTVKDKLNTDEFSYICEYYDIPNKVL